MSTIEKAAAMLRREAESMKACHTVGVGGEWYGESAKAESRHGHGSAWRAM